MRGSPQVRDLLGRCRGKVIREKWDTRQQRGSSPPSGTDFGATSYVSSLSCLLLYETGEQPYVSSGATRRIQRNETARHSGSGRC